RPNWDVIRPTIVHYVSQNQEIIGPSQASDDLDFLLDPGNHYISYISLIFIAISLLDPSLGQVYQVQILLSQLGSHNEYPPFFFQAWYSLSSGTSNTGILVSELKSIT